MYVDMNVTKQQYNQSISRFWFCTQAHWQVDEQLQFHCLSRLNPFIPCVCAFTYLSPSIISMADMSSSSHPSVLFIRVHAVVNQAREHVNTQSISGHTWTSGTRVQQTPGKWYINRYWHTIILHAGALPWSMWGSLRLAPINIMGGM